MAVSGGALLVLHPIGVAVVGVAGMCAASLFDIALAAALTAPAVAGSGHRGCRQRSSGRGDLGRRQRHGSWAGRRMGRRQSAAAGPAGRRRSRLLSRRAEVEHERAEVSAERNRIAREVHDVLGAHAQRAIGAAGGAGQPASTTGPTADEVQAAADPVPSPGHRGARGDPPRGAGAPRRAGRRRGPGHGARRRRSRSASTSRAPASAVSAAGLALVRVAQEAVTNARKHAAGAVVTVDPGLRRRKRPS